MATKAQRKDFTERIVKTFYKQSHGNQFAAIVYCSEAELKKGLESVKFTTEDEYGCPLLDSSIACAPECDEDITNYLAARPVEYDEEVACYYANKHSNADKIHTEEILLKNLERLTSEYECGQLPEHIFLYTWITPCTKCSELIIDKLRSPPYDKIPTTILYTTNTHTKGDDVEQAKQSLRDAGFEVERVRLWFPQYCRDIASV